MTDDSTVLDSGLHLTSGSVVNGRFKLIRKLGKGGTARVWQARHILGGFDVALKFLDTNSDWLGKDEFRVLSSLYHPNIVRIMDLGAITSMSSDRDTTPPKSLPRQHFLLMEHVQGHTLRDYVTREIDFRPKAPAAWLSQMVEVLRYLHSESILHRDIKPSNIVIDSRTLHPRAVLIDFNISNIHNPNAGTPRYKCPIVLNEGKWHRFADTWALAVTFYELLTGDLLFMEDPHPRYDAPLKDTCPVPSFPASTYKSICEIISRTNCDIETPPSQYHALFGLQSPISFATKIPESVAEKYHVSTRNQRFLVLHMINRDSPTTPKSRNQLIREALASADRPAKREVVASLDRVFAQLRSKGVVEYHGHAKVKKVALSPQFVDDYRAALGVEHEH